jgi:hypothetical protein
MELLTVGTWSWQHVDLNVSSQQKLAAAYVAILFAFFSLPYLDTLEARVRIVLGSGYTTQITER